MYIGRQGLCVGRVCLKESELKVQRRDGIPDTEQQTWELGLPSKTCSSATRAVPRGDQEPCHGCQEFGVMAATWMKMTERSRIRELIWN